jgi:ATP adenylyltransferase
MKSSVSEPVVADSTWPNHHQVLYRPDRLNYVRKLVRAEGCVFCSALEAGVKAESLLIATLGDAMLVLNKYPYNAGHVLILPKRHLGSFDELTAKEAADIHQLQTKALNALTDLYSPGGFNMGLNLGAAAGAGIPDHLHWHLIPRWSGDSNFFPLIAQTKVVVETLERTFERLVAYFGEAK